MLRPSMNKVLFKTLSAVFLAFALLGCSKPYSYEEALDIIKEYTYLEELEVVESEESNEAYLITILNEGEAYTYEISKSKGEVLSVSFKEEKEDFSYLENGNISYDDALLKALDAYGKLKDEATNFVLIDESASELSRYHFTYEDGYYLYEVDIDPKDGEMLSMQRSENIKEVYLFEGEIGMDEAIEKAKEELGREKTHELSIMAIANQTPYYEVRIDEELVMINALNGEVLG